MSNIFSFDCWKVLIVNSNMPCKTCTFGEMKTLNFSIAWNQSDRFLLSMSSLFNYLWCNRLLGPCCPLPKYLPLLLLIFMKFVLSGQISYIITFSTNVGFSYVSSSNIMIFRLLHFRWVVVVHSTCYFLLILDQFTIRMIYFGVQWN